MKERPILFSGEMVRAILSARKTQTRRVIKPQPANGQKFAGIADAREYLGPKHKNQFGAYFGWSFRRCPYGQPGDKLWVRETFLVDDNRRIPKTATHKNFEVDYKATSEDSPHWRWRPSIHMPRWASRITLEITGVRVERLHDISEVDARAEGAPDITGVVMGGKLRGIATYRDWFKNLWQSINGADSWASNPWVWVIEFKRLT